MKKFLLFLSAMLCGMLSVLLTQYAVKKFYKRWNHRSYADIYKEDSGNPWG